MISEARLREIGERLAKFHASPNGPTEIARELYLEVLILRAYLYSLKNGGKPRREEVISFAYGNLKLHNPNITRGMVEAEYDKMHPEDKNAER